MGKLNRTNFNATVNAELDTIVSLQENIGNVSDLETENKDLVSAINEVKTIGNNVKQELVSSLLSVDSSLPITNDSTWDEVNASIANIQSGTGLSGIIKEYEVQAGENISAGDFVQFVSTGNTITPDTPVVFESGDSSYISAVKLTDTKVFVVYKDGNNGNYGTANILTINGTSITVGVPFVFESSRADYIWATALNENKVLVAYEDYANNRYGKAVILTIDGSSITVGTPIIFNTAGTIYITATTLTENKVLVCYSNDGNNGRGTSIILTIDGTSITTGTPVEFESGNTQYISAVKLTENKAVVCHQDYGNNRYGTAVVLTINGTDITVGTPVVFETGAVSYVSAVRLSENKVFVAYADVSNSSRGTYTILYISGSSISFTTPVVFNSAQTYYISAARINSNRVFVSCQDGTNNTRGGAIIFSIDGSTVTTGTTTIYAADNITDNSAVVLDESRLLVAYEDNGNSAYGTAVVISTDIKSFAKKSTSRQNIRGVAQTSGTEGQLIEVITL